MLLRRSLGAEVGAPGRETDDDDDMDVIPVAHPTGASGPLAPLNPRVAIVIPVWDAYVAFLPAALESIRQQEGPEVSVVVVDNASSTPVPEFEGVKVVRTDTRLTVGEARNVGLDAVDGPYVLFWDADDVMLPGTLSYLVSALEADAEAVAAVCGWTSWNHATSSQAPWGWPLEWAYRLSANGSRAFLLRAAVLNPFPTTGATLMRTSTVRTVGGYAELNFGEDWTLAVKLIMSGRVLIARRAGRLYRIHRGSLYNAGFGRASWTRATAQVRRAIQTHDGAPRWVKALLPAIHLYHATWTWLYADNRPHEWLSVRLGEIPLVPHTLPPVPTRTSGWYVRRMLGIVKRTPRNLLTALYDLPRRRLRRRA